MEQVRATKQKPSLLKRSWALKIGLFFVFLIILTLAILPFFINPIAETLIKQQAALIFGDKLSIGSVHVSLWSGGIVEVNQVNLLQPPQFTPGSLLNTASIKIRVDLIPLLKKQLIIKKITVINPQITLIQTKKGTMNVTYYLSKFTAPAAPGKDPEYTVELKQFDVINGRIVINSLNLSDRQPTFELVGCNFNLSNIELPNRSRLASPFRFTGQLVSTRRAQVSVDGKGVFGAGPLSFTAKSKINNLYLPDYAFLAPNSSYAITEGTADVVSDARCNNNYLKSQQHVEVTHLKLVSKKKGFFGGTLIGVPANVFIKVIQDKRGSFGFDFSVTGQLDHLKTNIKFQVGEAIAKGIRSKFGLTTVTGKAVGGLKKVGQSIDHFFSNLFKKKKK